MKNFFNNRANLLPILLGATLFIYLVLRVFNMVITDDEYTTINVHATMSWWDILITGQPNIVWAPNNHVMNTLFVKLEMGIFGKKDWAVRLHILLAFIFCYYYAVKIVQLLTPSRIRQLLYLFILLFNPYLLDFFVMARGYAMSIAGLMAALYYFFVYTESLSLKHLRFAFLALFIAVWSNFSALYVLALMGLSFLYEIYLHRESINVKRNLLNIIIASLSIGLISIIPLVKTIHSGESFGGKTGLFQDLIVNYVRQFIHINPHISRHADFSLRWKSIEVEGLVILFLWFLLQVTSLFFDVGSRLRKMHFYSLFLVIGVAAIAKILFVFFEVPYPTARTELLYSIPFYLGICCAFERIIQVKRFVVIPLSLIIMALVWHFGNSISLEKNMEWWQTGDAKKVVRFLKEELNKTHPDKVIDLGIEAWQYPSLAFYTETELKDVMATHWTDLSTDGHYDYLFVSSHLTGKVDTAYQVIQKFEHGVLFRAISNKQNK